MWKDEMELRIREGHQRQVQRQQLGPLLFNHSSGGSEQRLVAKAQCSEGGREGREVLTSLPFL